MIRLTYPNATIGLSSSETGDELTDSAATPRPTNPPIFPHTALAPSTHDQCRRRAGRPPGCPACRSLPPGGHRGRLHSGIHRRGRGGCAPEVRGRTASRWAAHAALRLHHAGSIAALRHLLPVLLIH